MKIKQDPITKLWCRSDGAVLIPPSGKKFGVFRWTFGSKQPVGYCAVRFHGKNHRVHCIVCRAFNGLSPEGRPFVDHINRIKNDNRPENLRWVSNKENCNNKDYVDQSIEKYGVRCCEDRAVYDKAYVAAHRERISAYRRAYDATKHAEKRAQGLTWRKGPDGKWGWFPFKRT